MKAKQNYNPDPKLIKGLLDLNRRKDFLLLEKELEVHLKKFQNSPFLHNLLGSTLANQGRLEESIESFNEAIEFSGNKPTYLNNLGITFLKLNRINEAISTFTKSVDLDTTNINSNFFLGNALRKSGRIEESIISYEAVIKLDPNHSQALLLKSLSLKNLGKFDESVSICKKAIASREGFGMAHRHLTSLITYEDKEDPHILEMESIYNTNSLDLEDRMQLAFGLGKSLEDVREYKKAFFYLKEGNKIHRKNLKYSTANRTKLFSLIKDNFTKDFFDSSTELLNQGKKMIFVLGLPRSGTSLVEQILSSHSRVYGAGEKRFLHEAINEVLLPLDGINFPKNVNLYDQNSFNDLGRVYLQLIKNLGKDKDLLVVDKMPHNFQYIGVIHKALSEARIILCEREPLDNCYSIFKQKFGSGNEYAYSLEEVGEYYNLYVDLIAHWESVLPNKLYKVKYEELTFNQEKISREMIEFCDLEWEEGCMSFHSTSREVKTASAVQVRQPIYTSSVDLWRKYENELEPLKNILNKEN